MLGVRSAKTAVSNKTSTRNIGVRRSTNTHVKDSSKDHTGVISAKDPKGLAEVPSASLQFSSKRRKPSASDSQNLVDEMIKPTKSIEVPPQPPFGYPEDDADDWSVPVTVKYLITQMEMPDYENRFKKAEIDGRKLISMDEEHQCGVEIDHKLHALKIATHAQSLRQRVLEKAFIDKPISTADWQASHIAAWLYYDKKCADTAVLVLRSQLNGARLLQSKNGREVITRIKGLEMPDIDEATVAFDELLNRVALDSVSSKPTDELPPGHKLKATGSLAPTGAMAAMSKEEGVAETDAGSAASNVAARKGKKNKSVTAIQLRREQEQAEKDAEFLRQNPIASSIPAHPLDGATVVDFAEIDPSLETKSILSGSKKKISSPSSITQSRAWSSTSKPFSDPDGLLFPIIEETSRVEDSEQFVDKGKVDHGLNGDDSDRLSINPANVTPAAAAAAATASASASASASATVPPAVVVGDTYSRSGDRAEFLERIAHLRKVVEDHSQIMSQLRRDAVELKRENLAAHEQQKQLLKESSASRVLIDSLVQDRNAALRELEGVVRAYEEQISREQSSVYHGLISTTYDTEQTLKENSTIVQHYLENSQTLSTFAVPPAVPESYRSALQPAPGVDSSAGVGGEAQTHATGLAPPQPHTAITASPGRAIHGANQETLLRGLAGALEHSNLNDKVKGKDKDKDKDKGKHVDFNDDDDEDSDLEDEIDRRLRAQIAQSSPGRDGKKNHPEAHQQASPLPIPLNQEDPVSLAKQRLVNSLNHAAALNGPVGANTTTSGMDDAVDLVGMVGRSADEACTLWQEITTKYRLPRSNTVENVADNKLLLHHIAVMWVRLGRADNRRCSQSSIPERYGGAFLSSRWKYMRVL